VIRPPREHLAILKPLNGILMLETMHFADELLDPQELKPPAAAVGQKELEMALTLVKSMTGDWKPEKYHDEYREALMKVIEQKVKAGNKKLPAPKAARKAGAEKVIDLVALLQESVGQSAKRRKTKPKPAPKTQRKAA
jgi:DNA end-binding protein Ku